MLQIIAGVDEGGRNAAPLISTVRDHVLDGVRSQRRRRCRHLARTGYGRDEAIHENGTWRWSADQLISGHDGRNEKP